ncbi:hypothetical protein [Paenibacillus sp. HB172176]|uniref:hypothetical protein n=1 Tax=Paenibacillus sp. HB172176 TaxID=2493690 RepID=UPI001439A9CA|nr:hypothetical protein [Paenibacillus sp. HB172176]
MKKSSLVVLSLILALSIVPAGVSAKNSPVDPQNVNNYSDEDINQILINSGMPEEKVEQTDIDLKRAIIRDNGENLSYTGSENKDYKYDFQGKLVEVEQLQTSGGITTMGAISSADLSFTVLVFDGTGTNVKEIYGGWQWNTTGNGPSETAPQGVYKDVMAIAIPDGWEIQSNSYSSEIYKNERDPYTSQPTTWQLLSGGYDNNGQPATDGYDLYGAAWRMSSAASSPFAWFKGHVHFDMKKVQSDAINRVLVKYMEAQSNPFTGFSATLGWTPLSVTYTPTNGSTNIGSLDYTFTM